MIVKPGKFFREQIFEDSLISLRSYQRFRVVVFRNKMLNYSYKTPATRKKEMKGHTTAAAHQIKVNIMPRHNRDR